MHNIELKNKMTISSEVVEIETDFIELEESNLTNGEENHKNKIAYTEEALFDFETFRNKIKKSYKQISISRKMRKFYRRRYQLFNRFDSGVLMDLESW